MLRWNDWARDTYSRLLRGCGGRKKVADCGVGAEAAGAIVGDVARWYDVASFGLIGINVRRRKRYSKFSPPQRKESKESALEVEKEMV